MSEFVVNTGTFPPSVDYRYRLCGVPDLDQKRTASGDIPGLPRKGKMWCVPTSAMNLLAFLADAGLPVRPPGSNNWMNLSRYKQMTKYLTTLGDYMDTDPVTGTGPSDAPDGLAEWLDDTPVGGSYVTSAFFADHTKDPNVVDVATEALAGGLVMLGFGRYKEVKPGRFARDGGHYSTLTAAFGNTLSGRATLYVRNPAHVAGGDTDRFSQSDYVNQAWTVRDRLAYFSRDKDDDDPDDRYVLSQVVRFDGVPESGRFIDSFVVLRPEVIAGAVGKTMVFVASVTAGQAAAAGQTAAPSALRKRFKSATGTRVMDVAMTARGHLAVYLARGSNRVWQLNRLTGASTPVGPAIEGPRQLVTGGRDETTFVAARGELLALSPEGTVRARRKLGTQLGALEYDARANRLVGLSSSGRRLLLFDRNLRRRGTRTLPASALAGRGAPLMSIGGDGRIVIRRSRSNRFARTRLKSGNASAVRIRARDIKLRKLSRARVARGLATDDDGHIFVTVKGRVVEYLPSGRRARSRLRVPRRASLMSVSRSFSDFNAREFPQTLDYNPNEVSP